MILEEYHTCSQIVRCSWAKKLETVFFVAIPSEEHRNNDRIVPERPDIYIIAPSDCTPGTVLNDWDHARYYGNSKILACLVLKPPDDGLVPNIDIARRVTFTSAFDNHAGLTDIRVAALPSNERLSDEIDRTQGFPPRPLQFSATLAQPPVNDFTLLHRILEKEHGNKTHWLENVARFKPGEMAAGVEGINNELCAAYTLTCMFMSNERANKVCKDGGILVGDEDGFTVSLCSPADLGWQKNAMGEFRKNVAHLMKMAPEDVQTVVVLAIPTSILEQTGKPGHDTFRVNDPRLFMKPKGGDSIYSGAHIQKIYELESTFLVEARKQLEALRAGTETGGNQAELEQKVQRMMGM